MTKTTRDINNLKYNQGWIWGVLILLLCSTIALLAGYSLLISEVHVTPKCHNETEVYKFDKDLNLWKYSFKMNVLSVPETICNTSDDCYKLVPKEVCE